MASQSRTSPSGPFTSPSGAASNLPLRSGHSRIVYSPAHLTHVSALSGPSNRSYPASYAERTAEEPTMLFRFPAALLATGIRFLGHPAPAEEPQPSSRSAYRTAHIRTPSGL